MKNEQDPGQIKRILIPFEIFRRSWFETGGTDIFGDATDYELDMAERVVIDTDFEADSQAPEDARGIRPEDIDILLA